MSAKKDPDAEWLFELASWYDPTNPARDTLIKIAKRLNNPRKVKLPEGFTLDNDYGLERTAGDQGPLLMRDEVIAALKVAGVEVE